MISNFSPVYPLLHGGKRDQTLTQWSCQLWFNNYRFTIEGTYEAGKDFCFALRDCSIEIDPTYFYPKMIIYGSRAVFVDNFKACESVSECLPK